MPTDDKNKFGYQRDGADSTRVNPAPNVSRDPFPVEGSQDHHAIGDEDALDDLLPTQEELAEKARWVRDQAAQGAREMAGQLLNEAPDEIQELLSEVEPILRNAVQQRPIAVTIGAFTLGYVIAAGIPRWMVRLGARVAMPIAVAGVIGRAIGTVEVEPDTALDLDTDSPTGPINPP